MKRLLAATIALSALGSSLSLAQESPAPEQTHSELRALKQKLVDAVNQRDEATLLALMSPKITFTAMNNDYFVGRDGAKAYYDKMLVGSQRIIDDIKVDAEATRLSEMFANNMVATAIGSTNAHFKLATGATFDIPLRWSAAMVRDNGAWTVANLHFSANVFDNPVSKVVSGLVYLWAGLAGLLGLVAGWLLSRVTRR